MLAWLYWNPQRELFTIPYLDRPIAWYGVFFALGFVIGYWILLHICRSFFAKEPFFMVSDVTNWARFLMTLRNKKSDPFIHNFLASLPNPLQEKILQWNLTQEVDEGFQKAIIFGMNHYLKQEVSQSRKEKRDQFEELFPCSLQRLDVKVKFLAERLCFYTIVGTVIGARLGHIVFYENLREYLSEPLRILKTWEGGLASHGALIGIVIAFAIFLRRYKRMYPQIGFRRVLDFFVVPAALGGCLIRIGNFFNQEILGKSTQIPWAIIFGAPADGGMVIPRHPAQLYEAWFYLIVFLVLMRARKYEQMILSPGKIAGIGFIVVFAFRFFIEFFKEEQSVYHGTLLNVGQFLSIPFILLGIALYFSETLFKKKSQEVFSQHSR